MASLTRVRIRGMAHGGAGVGSAVDPAADTRTWFVEGALPGEVVDATCHKQAKRHLRGAVAEVVEPAEERIAPPCPIADRCGGCGWQHVSPTAHAPLKGAIVEDQLRRLKLSVDGVVPSPQADGYRRRARMHYDNGAAFELGFRRRRSREIAVGDACMVLTPALDRAMRRVDALREHLPPQGEVHGLTDGTRVVVGLPGVRVTPELEAAALELLDEELVGFVVRGGRKRLGVGVTELEIDGDGPMPPVRVGPFGFAQAQEAQNRALVEHVVEAAQAENKRVLELYAGAGNFTRGLAARARKVFALDDDREGVKQLRATMEQRRLPVTTKRANAEKWLAQLAASDKRWDVVVVDPPRAGLGIDASLALAEVAIERIVYVSCDPATLARDLEALLGADERLTVDDVTVFDLMPRTPEVEVVVTVVRAASPDESLPSWLGE